MLHNPNNWHWVNKDASSWTKQYLEDHIKDIKAEEDGVTAQLDKLISMEGDVDVNQRKGKVITIFDVKLVIEYSGTEQNLSSGNEMLTDQAKPRMTTMSAAQSLSPRLLMILKKTSMLYVSSSPLGALYGPTDRYIV
jgi:activator of HSP90 ATPase